MRIVFSGLHEPSRLSVYDYSTEYGVPMFRLKSEVQLFCEEHDIVNPLPIYSHNPQLIFPSEEVYLMFKMRFL